MANKTFISFRGEDEFEVWSLRNLSEFKNVSFVMDDISLRNAVNSDDNYYIRRVIRPKIESCNICLCMMGENTYRSRKWVPWEIKLALEENKPVIAMRFKDTPNAVTPSLLSNNGIIPFDWNIDRLFGKLGE